MNDSDERFTAVSLFGEFIYGENRILKWIIILHV